MCQVSCSRWAVVAATLTLLAAGCGGGDSGGGNDSEASNTPDTSVSGDTSTSEGLTVTSVQPASGPLGGDTTVTISGTGFQEGAEVQFGDRKARDASVVSDFKIEATTPEADDPGAVAVRVSISGGGTDELSEGFEYTGEGSSAKPTVDWCKLQHPPSATTTVGSEAGPIFGRVFVDGCSNGEQKCDTVTAEVGWGSPEADPATSPGNFQWREASYNPDHTSDDNDEYQSTIPSEEPGTYAYTYRFSVDGGDNWTYCDLDDSSNGFQPDQMGEWTVEEEPEPTVDWCTIQHPKEVTIQKGETSPRLFSRVYSKDCTESDDRCEALTAEFGWGASDNDPSSNPSAFNWQEATYNANHASGDNNDEYEATVSPQKAGTFDYLFRYSDDGGDTWRYCDTDGNDGEDNGFQPDKTGTMTVEEKPETTVDWCNIQHPKEVTVETGETSPRLFSRVYSKNCTESPDQCQALEAQFGWGEAGTDPSSNPSAFDWTSATYNDTHDSSDNNDEYEAQVTPQQTGGFAYLFRYSSDGGNSWTYCDTDGNDGTNNGFQPDKIGTMTVEEPQQTTVSIDWCKLQFPKSINTKTGDKQTVYGRVYSQGCTDDQGGSRVECEPITGELGWGPTDVDPSNNSSSYTWTQASYNDQFPPMNKPNNNDEHVASFTPSQTGTFDYVFRFSGDGGQSWTYCDTDGAPFATDNEGSLEVR